MPPTTNAEYKSLPLREIFLRMKRKWDLVSYQQALQSQDSRSSVELSRSKGSRYFIIRESVGYRLFSFRHWTVRQHIPVTPYSRQTLAMCVVKRNKLSDNIDLTHDYMTAAPRPCYEEFQWEPLRLLIFLQLWIRKMWLHKQNMSSLAVFRKNIIDDAYLGDEVLLRRTLYQGISGFIDKCLT